MTKRITVAAVMMALGLCIAFTGCGKKSPGAVDKTAVSRGYEEEGDIHHYSPRRPVFLNMGGARGFFLSGKPGPSTFLIHIVSGTNI